MNCRNAKALEEYDANQDRQLLREENFEDEARIDLANECFETADRLYDALDIAFNEVDDNTDLLRKLAEVLTDPETLTKNLGVKVVDVLFEELKKNVDKSELNNRINELADNAGY